MAGEAGACSLCAPPACNLLIGIWTMTCRSSVFAFRTTAHGHGRRRYDKIGSDTFFGI